MVIEAITPSSSWSIRSPVRVGALPVRGLFPRLPGKPATLSLHRCTHCVQRLQRCNRATVQMSRCIVAVVACNACNAGPVGWLQRCNDATPMARPVPASLPARRTAVFPPASQLLTPPVTGCGNCLAVAPGSGYSFTQASVRAVGSRESASCPRRVSPACSLVCWLYRFCGDNNRHRRERLPRPRRSRPRRRSSIRRRSGLSISWRTWIFASVMRRPSSSKRWGPRRCRRCGRRRITAIPRCAAAPRNCLAPSSRPRSSPPSASP